MDVRQDPSTKIEVAATPCACGTACACHAEKPCECAACAARREQRAIDVAMQRGFALGA